MTYISRVRVRVLVTVVCSRRQLHPTRLWKGGVGGLKRFENGGRLSFLLDEETTVLQHGRMMIAFRRD